MGQPGKLEVLLQKRITSEKIVIPPGSRILFGVNGIDLFRGLIENVEFSKDGTGRQTYILHAVDHLKLLQRRENAYREEGMTASDFFMHLGNKFNEGFAIAGASLAVLEASTAALDHYYFINESLYSMIMQSMTATHIAEAPDRLYMVRDNLGVIEWREMKSLQLPIVFGDNSLQGKLDNAKQKVEANHPSTSISRSLGVERD